VVGHFGVRVGLFEDLLHDICVGERLGVGNQEALGVLWWLCWRQCNWVAIR
jgi:hypothetical protein